LVDQYSPIQHNEAERDSRPPRSPPVPCSCLKSFIAHPYPVPENMLRSLGECAYHNTFPGRLLVAIIPQSFGSRKAAAVEFLL
jgi:hypothetical protein